jgi:hypothetical protein
VNRISQGGSPVDGEAGKPIHWSSIPEISVVCGEQLADTR